MFYVGTSIYTNRTPHWITAHHQSRHLLCDERACSMLQTTTTTTTNKPHSGACRCVVWRWCRVFWCVRTYGMRWAMRAMACVGRDVFVVVTLFLSRCLPDTTKSTSSMLGTDDVLHTRKHTYTIFTHFTSLENIKSAYKRKRMDLHWNLLTDSALPTTFDWSTRKCRMFLFIQNGLRRNGTHLRNTHIFKNIVVGTEHTLRKCVSEVCPFGSCARPTFLRLCLRSTFFGRVMVKCVNCSPSKRGHELGVRLGSCARFFLH